MESCLSIGLGGLILALVGGGGVVLGKRLKRGQGTSRKIEIKPNIQVEDDEMRRIKEEVLNQAALDEHVRNGGDPDEFLRRMRDNRKRATDILNSND